MQRFKTFLLEARQDYFGMFKTHPEGRQKVKNQLSDIETKTIKTIIRRAKSILKKNDRIVWFLRLYKAGWLHTTSRSTPQEIAKEYNTKSPQKITPVIISDNRLHHMDVLLVIIQHYLNLNIPEINNYVFQGHMPWDLTGTFDEIEKKWRESLGDNATRTRAKEFLKIDEKYSWYDLESNKCEEEAELMGHCATGPSGTTILSLREKIKDKKKGVFYKSQLTFILHNDGKIGEMKARFNKKPEKRYHRHIVNLLLDKRIKGFHSQSEHHASQNNFSLKDLPEKLREKLVKYKPEFITFRDKVSIFLKNGDKKLLQSLLKDTKFKFDIKQKKIIWSTMQWEDLFDNVHVGYGYTRHQMTGKKFINWIEGNNYDFIDYEPTERDIKDNLNSQQLKAIEEYVHVKYPDWEERHRDEFDEFVGKDEGDFETGYSGIIQAYQSATKSGAWEEIQKEVNSMLKTSIEMEHQYHGGEISGSIYPNKWTGGSGLVKILVGIDDVFRNMPDDINEPDEFSDWLGDLDYKLQFNEPQYGFSGFDDKYFESEVDYVIKEMKREVRKL